MKKAILFTLLTLSFPISSLANDVILRCQDRNGGILYINSKNIEKDKTLKCDTTNLAQIDVLPPNANRNNAANNATSTPNNQAAQTKPNTNSSTPNRNTSIDLAQIDRERRRIELLQNEISQEKRALESVQGMLNNLSGSNDKEQFSKLSSMKEQHERNIANLEKEIGTKDNLSGMLEINLNSARSVSGPPAPTSLPINLPN